MSIKITPSPHGRWEYIPAGGMALTAEQVEDVRRLLDELASERDECDTWDLYERVRALFPATKPAEATGNCSEIPNSSSTVVHVHHHDTEAHAASFNEGYDEAMRQLAESESVDIESLIEKSSLGTESARVAIDSVPPEHGRLIVAVAEQRAKTEALAKFMYEHGNPDLSQEDREILGPWEAMDEVTQKIWINLADAAYTYLADEIDSEKELLIEKVNQLQEQVKHLSRVAVNAAEHGIPAPAEPAEEETKAERKFPADTFGEVVRIVWTTYYYGADNEWHNARTGAIETREDLIEEARKANGDWHRLVPEASSPVVPAPTETEWQTWQEVPEGVPYRSSLWRSGAVWFNRDNNRYVQTSSVRNLDGTSYISGVDDDDMNTNLAPFVAAEEG